jgi:beta-N-acetylhexosaminidase
MTSAVVFGCAGPTLSRDERAFFSDADPWGLILFRRNVESADQVRALTEAFRETVGREDAPVLIDQEGGRVQRLRPPSWPTYPAAMAYADLASDDPLVRREIVRLGARLIAHDLRTLGITVDCAPVLDVPAPDGHEIIGDRAFGRDADTVATLGRAFAEGLLAGGVLPVIKHVPGHGRATADSHRQLPTVDIPSEVLDDVDLRPFRVNSDMPAAMTAHVVYRAVDPKRPATTSKKAIRWLREETGFDGLLLTDDLSMQALSGSLTERAEAARKAGCDVLLHCNGDPAEMAAVMKGAGKLKGEAKRRAEAALARIVHTPEPLDEAEARDRFRAAFGGEIGRAADGPAAGEA